jgi:hypothetical protein
MKKPKIPSGLRVKSLHDLACSRCGQINLLGSTIAETITFCPQCQQNTQHYSIATRQAGSTTPFGLPKRRKGKSLYSPEGKKKMGFGKGKK